jgi:hypothetical protein
LPHSRHGVLHVLNEAGQAVGAPGRGVIANVADGELRTALWQTLDARVEKSVTIGGNSELAVFGVLLNLTKSDANESVLDRRPGNVNYLVPSRFIAPPMNPWITRSNRSPSMIWMCSPSWA